MSGPRRSHRDSRASSEALFLSESLLEGARGGAPVDPRMVQRLRLLTDLLGLRQIALVHRMQFVPIIAALFAFAIAVALGAVRLGSAHIAVDATVSRLAISFGGGDTPKSALFGFSRWAKFSHWSSVKLPRTCPLNDLLRAPGAHDSALRVRANDDPDGVPLMLGIGDSVPMPDNVRIVVQALDDTSVSVASEDASNPLSIPVAMRSGEISIHDAAGAAHACPLSDIRLVLTANHATFAPSRIVGPLHVSSIGFDEDLFVSDSDRKVLSSVQSAVLEFRDLQGEQIRLTEGARLELTPNDDGAVLYVRPEKGGLRLFGDGDFTLARVSGKDIRPSYLEYLWKWPPARLLSAALSAMLAVTLSLLRWLGYRT